MFDDGGCIAGSGFIEGFERRYPTSMLQTLLADRTTGKNIIWADSEYEPLGSGYMGDDDITVEKITGLASGVVKPRIAKEAERQSQRTKSRAEVFTPAWLVNQMNNDLDEVWFGRRDVFNVQTENEHEEKRWTANLEPVTFPKSKRHGWQAYVASTRLEITCGEAPFICSRYDAVSGKGLPVRERVGFLDRKLRVVSEKTRTRNEWVKWALVALKATYGYEYQGDSLLIARLNVLETFAEHLRERWDEVPAEEELNQAAQVVSWNLWQMNGFTDAVPTNKMGAVVQSTLFDDEAPKCEPAQASLFDFLGEPPLEEFEAQEPKETVPLCVIYNWQTNEPFEFASLKGRSTTMNSRERERERERRFYAVIGNPPYQETSGGEKKADASIYNYFMDASYEVAERAELITPARFLFDNGNTPKAWNRKMLSDKHFKVLHYVESSGDVFANTDIKGGVVISYRDSSRDFEPVVHFTQHKELNGILAKVQSRDESSIMGIIFNQSKFDLLALYRDYPSLKDEVSSDGHEQRLTSGCFNFSCFRTHSSDDCDEFRILGKTNNVRSWKYLDSKYINPTGSNLSGYKVIIPANNGSGELGETIAAPVVAGPGDGFTQTFISFGNFSSKNEAEATLKYLKAKLCRTLLGILKITQNGKKPVWEFVPLQDFTANSDIDWSKSIPEIDQQLYAKYGLDEGEIEFIESHVKEMN